MIRVGKKKMSWNSTKFRLGGIASEKITKIDWGEKINDELVRGARRDGVPLGVTAGDYEPDIMTISFLVDEWFGNGVNQGYAQKLAAAAGTTGLADIEFDVFLQLIEENVGVVTANFPVNRIVAPKGAWAKGPGALEVDIGIRVIDPIVVNGISLASALRGVTV